MEERRALMMVITPMTENTPTAMPSMVSEERSLLVTSPVNASRSIDPMTRRCVSIRAGVSVEAGGVMGFWLQPECHQIAVVVLEAGFFVDRLCPQVVVMHLQAQGLHTRSRAQFLTSESACCPHPRPRVKRRR